MMYCVNMTYWRCFDNVHVWYVCTPCEDDYYDDDYYDDDYYDDDVALFGIVLYTVVSVVA